MGFLIVMDGVDASGKETQTRLLTERLEKSGRRVRRISFPCYDMPWIAPVKMYLDGSFGKSAGDVNAYAASTLFAMDRFASYKTDWKKDYDAGVVIIADRYVSSNMIHQAGKIENTDEKREFLEWLEDFEFKKIGIPRPDITVFLDMPVEYGRELIKNRKNKIDGSDVHDIHERDLNYLENSYKNAVDVAKLFGWSHISCVKDRKIRAIEEIADEVFARIESVLNRESVE